MYYKSVVWVFVLILSCAIASNPQGSNNKGSGNKRSKSVRSGTRSGTGAAANVINYKCGKGIITVDATGTKRNITLWPNTGASNIASTTADHYEITNVKVNTNVTIASFPSKDNVGGLVEGGKNFEVHTLQCTDGGSKPFSKTVSFNITNVNQNPIIDPTHQLQIKVQIKLQENGKDTSVMTIGHEVKLLISTEKGYELAPHSCVASAVKAKQKGTASPTPVDLLDTTGCSKHKSLLGKFAWGPKQAKEKIVATLYPFRFKGYTAVKLKCTVNVCGSAAKGQCTLPVCTTRIKRSGSMDISDNLVTRTKHLQKDVSLTVGVHDPEDYNNFDQNSSVRVAYQTRIVLALLSIPFLFRFL